MERDGVRLASLVRPISAKASCIRGLTPFYFWFFPPFLEQVVPYSIVSLSTGRYSIRLLLSKKIAFLRPHGFPFYSGSLYLRIGADFGNRHIPPALVAGHTQIAVVLNV